MRIAVESDLTAAEFIDVLAAPAAASYYPHIGMEQHDSCWMISPRDVDLVTL